MKKSDSIIRSGDTVKIVNPTIITRIGYDFTFAAALVEIKVNYKEEIYALMRKAHISISKWDKIVDRIAQPLAYDLVGKYFKSGNERKLYTEIRENLRDMESMVLSVKIAKTGIYFPPTCSTPSGEYGDYDYEPGGLKNPKTHIILEIDDIDDLNLKPTLIEACNVIKIS